uniref:Serpin domain-containing protein n=1 Tax=Acrobeloides nanus TaxID=290746 RepID=A0A914DUI0_9BILA
MIISPISISIALAMCYAGAKNSTADQISKAIAGDATNNEILDYFSSVMIQLNLRNKSYELDSANRIYVQEKFQFLQNYKQILTDKFQGQFKNIDFINSGAVAQVKTFVFLYKNAIDGLTRMILTNAIYFKGTWEYKFEKGQTKQKTFYLAENREQKVPMMKIKNPFPYYEDDQVQVLGLHYKSQEVVLYVVLPKERFGLNNVELPRFKIETELSLNNALKQLGITDAFDQQSADFSGMTGSRDLYVSDVVHKAFIVTSEEGSEAAAATGVVMTFMSPNGGNFDQLKTFHADHPFFYTLATRQGDVLFSGTVASLD